MAATTTPPATTSAIGWTISRGRYVATVTTNAKNPAGNQIASYLRAVVARRWTAERGREAHPGQTGALGARVAVGVWYTGERSGP